MGAAFLVVLTVPLAIDILKCLNFGSKVLDPGSVFLKSTLPSLVLT